MNSEGAEAGVSAGLRRSRRRLLVWGAVLVSVCALVLGVGVGLLSYARDVAARSGVPGNWTAVTTNCADSTGSCVSWVGTFAPDDGGPAVTGVQMEAGEVREPGQLLHGQLFVDLFYADGASLESTWGFGIVITLVAALSLVAILIGCVVKWRSYRRADASSPNQGDDPLTPVDHVSVLSSAPQELVVGQAHSAKSMGWAFVAIGIGCLLGPAFLIPEQSWGAAVAWTGAFVALLMLGLVPLTESTWLTREGITFRRWLFRSGLITWDQIESLGSQHHPFPTGEIRPNYQVTVVSRGKVALTVPSAWFGGTPDRDQAQQISGHVAAWGRQYGSPPFTG